MREVYKKYDTLINQLAGMKNMIVALSGGVDSALLAYAANEALGENVQTVTVVPPYVHQWEVQVAKETAQRLKIKHRALEVPFPEEIRQNPKDRCYHCKKVLFQKMIDTVNENASVETKTYHIVEGSNVDDTRVYRPGRKALQEMGIRSPLLDCGLTKDEIRSLAKEKELKVWDKPSNTCLLTRFPYGTTLDLNQIRKVEEAEQLIKALGFEKIRVRAHGDLLRIEIDKEKAVVFVQEERSTLIVKKLKDLGFNYITLDLEGIRLGCFD